jgi:hypothetical protein
MAGSGRGQITSGRFFMTSHLTAFQTSFGAAQGDE